MANTKPKILVMGATGQVGKDVIPHLTRSSLHRCLQRYGISRLPKGDRE